MLSAFSFCFASCSSMFSVYWSLFCFPGVPSGGVRMFVFFAIISSGLHPSRGVRACNLRKCAHSLVCFLPWFLALCCFLPAWIELFLLSLPFLICVCVFFFRFWFRFFDVELLFSSGLFLQGSMWSSRFLWRLVQRAACIWYVRARTSLFVFVWGRCRCASVIMCNVPFFAWCSFTITGNHSK